MHRSDNEAQAKYWNEAARRAAIAEVRARLAPLAVAAGMGQEEIEDLALVVELAERICDAAGPEAGIAGKMREVLEHLYRTRFGIDSSPAGEA
jgi:hypothetical protein